MNRKRCTLCGETKPLSEFHLNKATPDGRAYRCKVCRRSIYRQRYHSDRERLLEQVHEYKRNNQDKIRKRKRAYRARNKERRAEYKKRWCRENPDKAAAWGRNRYARRKAAPGNHTAEEFIALCERYGNCCLRCGKKKKLTADHVIPLSRGGSNEISNIQPLCKSCNSKKYTDTTDYRPGGKGIKRWIQKRLPLFGKPEAT